MNPRPAAQRVRVDRIEVVAPDVYTVDLVAISPPAIGFRPGQYVTIVIPGSGERRSYSIASPLGHRDGFTLLVRNIGAGSGFLTSLRLAAEIEFEGPRGDFGLAPEHPGDLVFAATGVGVSALFPMMEESLARGEGGQVRFFWGLSAPADQFWRPRLELLAAQPRFSSRVVFTRCGDGFITAHILDAAAGFRDPTFYLCGNGQMVRDVIDGLVSVGVDRARQIRTDWY